MADTQGAQRRAQRLMQKATKGHGTFMAKVGQAWAFPSLLAFSVGAFIKLGGEGLLPLSVATFGRIGATIILLISGVLALEIALFSIGDAISRKRVTLRLLWDVVLVTVVGPLETWTLFLLITGLPANGPTDLMRAAEAVVAVAYLGTLVIRPPTDRDFVRIIGSRAGERTMEKLEMIPLTEVGMGRLYYLQAVANDETLTWSARADRLVEAMEQLAPGEQERAYQQRIAELEATQAETLARAQREIAAAEDAARRASETSERQIADAHEQAHTQATQRTLDAVLALVATGKLPAWLIEQRPELADVMLPTGATGRRGSRASTTVNREPSSRVEKQRAFLLEQGIEPSAAPDGKRGVWLRSADLAALTGGKSGSETPQAMIRRLGDGLTVGRNLVAPFEPVMRELSERHLLADAARLWWARQAQSGDDAAADHEEMRQEMSATSRADVRGNVIPMRA